MTIGWYKEVDSMKKYIPFLLSLVVIMNFTISIVKAEQPLQDRKSRYTMKREKLRLHIFRLKSRMLFIIIWKWEEEKYII